MEYTHKATINQRTRNSNMIAVCIIGSISLLGLVMAIYSIFKMKLLFTLIYLIAVMFGFSYVVIRINTVLATYCASDENYIYMRNWDNGLFPFRTDKGFLGEFLPAGTNVKKIDASAITKIYLGTRNYLLKLTTQGSFYDELSCSDKSRVKLLKRMEFLYIVTRDNCECFMSVTGFDTQELISVLKPIVDGNERIDFKCNDRIISKSIPARKMTF